MGDIVAADNGASKPEGRETSVNGNLLVLPSRPLSINLEKTMNYFDHVQEGFVLTMEALMLVLVAICGCLFYFFGAPLYLVSKLSGRYFDKVNEAQIREQINDK